MMFGEIALITYQYIIEAEFLFLQKFKLNPFDLMNKMSLLDLFSYIGILE